MQLTIAYIAAVVMSCYEPQGFVISRLRRGASEAERCEHALSHRQRSRIVGVFAVPKRTARDTACVEPWSLVRIWTFVRECRMRRVSHSFSRSVGTILQIAVPTAMLSPSSISMSDRTVPDRCALTSSSTGMCQSPAEDPGVTHSETTQRTQEGRTWKLTLHLADYENSVPLGNSLSVF